MFATLTAVHTSVPAITYHWPVRGLIAFIAGLIVVSWSYWTIVCQHPGHGSVRFAILYDIVVFLVFGVAALITASTEWATAVLCAGAALLGGGFVGLLFGVSYQQTAISQQNRSNGNAAGGRAPDSDPAKAEAAVVDPNALPQQTTRDDSAKHDLLSDTAGWLSKIVAGATLASLHSLMTLYKQASSFVAHYISDSQSSYLPVLGGALILYFGLLGFLSGLFLPAYFMQNWQGGGGLGSNKPDL